MFISVEKHTSLFQSSDVGLLISVEIVLALILNDADDKAWSVASDI